MNARRSLRSSSAMGRCCCAGLLALNSGLSSTPRRIIQVTITISALSRNGMRQPQLSNCSSLSIDSGMNTEVARIEPMEAPLINQLV
ncbi:hypothetical protein D3C77_620300 [compost metagenome]